MFSDFKNFEFVQMHRLPIGASISIDDRGGKKTNEVTSDCARTVIKYNFWGKCKGNRGRKRNYGCFVLSYCWKKREGQCVLGKPHFRLCITFETQFQSVPVTQVALETAECLYGGKVNTSYKKKGLCDYLVWNWHKKAKRWRGQMKKSIYKIDQVEYTR